MRVCTRERRRGCMKKDTREIIRKRVIKIGREEEKK